MNLPSPNSFGDSQAVSATPSPAQPIAEFARKVCRYFLDFLETDFKRAAAPRRRIQLKNDAGFRTALPLRKYPTLADALWKLTQKPPGEGLALTISPRRYTATISPVLLNLIEQHVAALPAAQLERVRAALPKLAEGTLTQAADHPEAYIEGVQAGFVELVARELVAPLLALLEGVFRDQAYNAVESVYEIETDLVDALTSQVTEALPEALNTFLVKRDLDPVRQVLVDFFDDATVRERLVAFFAEFATADAFLEVRDLLQYASTTDTLQFYVYFVDLKFGAHTYPLFYLPARVELTENASYLLTLTPHLYVNKRAVDYVQQERENVASQNAISPVPERIAYLEPEQPAVSVMDRVLTKLVPVFDLPGVLRIDGGRLQQLATAQVRMSSAAYLAVFDRSDESVQNDYEELLATVNKSPGGVHALFENIVRGFILDEPKSILRAVDAQWQGLSIPERLIAESPIAVNEEQRKILTALQHPECRFVAVAGPPGCGKSHTITAIAFDAILNGRSTLILSDKQEALDVVQDKLEEALDSVRHGEEFPNPILRLGKTGGTYQRLIQQATQQRIRDQARAHQAHEPQLRAQRQDLEKNLQACIAKTVATLSSIDMRQMRTLHTLEAMIERDLPELLPALQATAAPPAPVSFDLPPDADLTLLAPVDEVKQERALLAFMAELKLPLATPTALLTALRLLGATENLAATLSTSDRAALTLLPLATPADAPALGQLAARYEALRMPLFGFLFRKAAVLALNQETATRFGATDVVELHRQLPLLRAAPALLQRIAQATERAALTPAQAGLVCSLLARQAVETPQAKAALSARLPLHGELTDLGAVLGTPVLNHPRLAVGQAGGPTPATLLTKLRELRHYVQLYHAIGGAMRAVPEFDYVGEKQRLEHIHVSRMANQLDQRFLDFVDNKKATAKSLGGVIKKQAKFPTDAFGNLREAFPCIIAGIREFAEYVPLHEDIFDVVVIDEASQVSVAQAFPALLRAKKVVVFGDEAQFSNVKSMNASNALNAGYLTDLDAYFRRHITQQADRIERLKMFDVKRSVLSFMGLIASYSTMLTKHFRGYQELISFSSRTFYDGRLQAIKVRGVPLEDVISFTIVDSTAPAPAPQAGDKPSATKPPRTAARTSRGIVRNTNRAEADYILDRLRELVEDEAEVSVGIITPFREQQQLLTKLAFEDADSEAFQSQLKLKIMTFDSCQGEERDLIFFSLVATADNDKLNYIFPVDLEATDQIEEQLKLQRLNVGFSRAKEAIEFVLSKPIEQYKGSIRKVLQHYQGILEAKGRPTSADTDPASPMEAKVLDWIQKTAFFQKHAERLEIVAQFKVGDYLRQLDPHYQHPRFRTDFLLRLRTPGRKTVQVIIEYDGLKEHLLAPEGQRVEAWNHYYRPEDVERQMVIEGYGYRFLRINRFNLGADPVATLSDRLEALLADAVRGNDGGARASAVDGMQQAAEQLANGDAKQCSRCGSVKPLAAFFDRNLREGKGGHGRICIQCKGGSVPHHKSRSWRR